MNVLLYTNIDKIMENERGAIFHFLRTRTKETPNDHKKVDSRARDLCVTISFFTRATNTREQNTQRRKIKKKTKTKKKKRQQQQQRASERSLLFTSFCCHLFKQIILSRGCSVTLYSVKACAFSFCRCTKGHEKLFSCFFCELDTKFINNKNNNHHHHDDNNKR